MPEAAGDSNGQDRRSEAAGLSRSPFAAQAASLAAGGESMEDMIASVRTILEAEELKERGRPPWVEPAPAETPLNGNG